MSSLLEELGEKGVVAKLVSDHAPVTLRTDESIGPQQTQRLRDGGVVHVDSHGQV
jgi:hypothetical protein